MAHTQHTTQHRVRKWLVLWAPVFLLACGGNSCTSCTVQGKAPVTPNALVLPETLKLRITQHGFDVVAAEAKPLLIAVLGQNQNGQAVLDISQLLGPVAINLNGGLGLFKGSGALRELVLTLDVQGMQLSLVDPSDPAKLRLTLDHAQIGITAGVVSGDASFAGINSNAACRVTNGIDKGKPTEHLATLSTTLDVQLGVDASGQLAADAQLVSVQLHDLGFGLDKDCSLPECTDKVLLEDPCLECNLCLAGNLAGNAAQTLTAVLEPILGQVLVALGNAVGKQLLLKALNGKPLDIELPLDIAALTGKLGVLGPLLGPADKIYLRGRPSPHAFTVHDAGLDATLDGSLYAPANPCVIDAGEDATTVFAKLPQTPPPAMPLTMLQPVMGGAGVEKTVDVGLMLSRSVVEEGLWSLLRSGSLLRGDRLAPVVVADAGQARLVGGRRGFVPARRTAARGSAARSRAGRGADFDPTVGQSQRRTAHGFAALGDGWRPAARAVETDGPRTGGRCARSLADCAGGARRRRRDGEFVHPGG